MAEVQSFQMFDTHWSEWEFERIKDNHAYIYYCAGGGEGDFVTLSFTKHRGKQLMQLLSGFVYNKEQPGLSLPDFQTTIAPLLANASIIYPLEDPKRTDFVTVLRHRPQHIADPFLPFNDERYKLIRVFIAPHHLKFGFADLSVPELTCGEIYSQLSFQKIHELSYGRYLTSSYVPYGPPDIEISLRDVTNVRFGVGVYQFDPTDPWEGRPFMGYWIPYTVSLVPEPQNPQWFDVITIRMNRIDTPEYRRCSHNYELNQIYPSVDSKIILQSIGNWYPSSPQPPK